jgi:beta-glucuronidase
MLFAGTRVELNGDWRFRTDPAGEGEKAGWMREMPAGTESVTVPHTWNIGAHEDYEGVGWYFRTFRIDSTLRTQHVELHFGATFYKARIWLNGTEIGSHEGGYTAYFFDITPYLSDTNYLAVELDNRPGEHSIPGIAGRIDERGWYDWWHYGGIIRDVWLTANDGVLMRRQKIRSKVADNAATVSDTVFVENTGKTDLPVGIVALAYGDGDAKPVMADQKITLKPGSNAVAFTMMIPKPRLWSFDHPNIYRMVVTVAGERSKCSTNKRTPSAFAPWRFATDTCCSTANGCG